MDRNHHKLIVDGNAFYELDLDCVRKKMERESGQCKRTGKKTQENSLDGEQKNKN